MGRNTRKNKAARIYERSGPFCEQCYQLVLPESLLKQDRWENIGNGYYQKNGNIVAVATIEHKIPKSLGGTDSDDNLATFCQECNHKSNIESQKNQKTFIDQHKLQRGKCRKCEKSIAPQTITSRSDLKGHIKIRELGAFCNKNGSLLSAAFLVDKQLYCFRCKDSV